MRVLLIAPHLVKVTEFCYLSIFFKNPRRQRRRFIYRSIENYQCRFSQLQWEIVAEQNDNHKHKSQQKRTGVVAFVIKKKERSGCFCKIICVHCKVNWDVLQKERYFESSLKFGERQRFVLLAPFICCLFGYFKQKIGKIVDYWFRHLLRSNDFWSRPNVSSVFFGTGWTYFDTSYDVRDAAKW